MSVALTPFQLWTLFIMLENPSKLYDSEMLLLRCCDSAIMALSEGAEDDELSKLESLGYITNDLPMCCSARCQQCTKFPTEAYGMFAGTCRTYRRLATKAKFQSRQ